MDDLCLKSSSLANDDVTDKLIAKVLTLWSKYTCSAQQVLSV
jgi:hypothetical protein